MLKLILILCLNWYASIPTLGPDLLPGSVPLPAEEIEVNEPWIIVNKEDE